MQIPVDEWRRITHKQRRTLINKERRRRKRQRHAIERENEERTVQAQLEREPDYHVKLAETERLKAEEERKEEAKRLLDHEAWLERERLAAEEYRKRKELEEKRKKDKEERERLIKEEWETLQAREKQVEEKRERTRREKEERLKEALTVDLEPTVQEGQPWHNPLAPLNATDANFGTEKDTHNCAFFLKTGACRFGDRCSKQHPRPPSSVTLLIPAMYESLGLKEQMLDERDQDTALEYDEGEQSAQFEAFFKDVLPEFSKAGKVVQFKVSCNHEPHLRGNVYVQYSSEEGCAEAFRLFNGRWYAQRQLSCEYSPVQKWKTAICGLFERGRCPKGKHCNFLHVFRNPGGAFARADRDLPTSSEGSERRTTPPRSSEKRHRSHSRDSSRGTYRSPSRESRHSTRELHRSPSRESRGSTRELHRSPSRESRGSTRELHRSPSRESRHSTRELHRSPSRESRGSTRELPQSHSRDSSLDMRRSHYSGSAQKEHRSHSKETTHRKHKKKHRHKKHSSSPLATPTVVDQDGQMSVTPSALTQTAVTPSALTI